MESRSKALHCRGDLGVLGWWEGPHLWLWVWGWLAHSRVLRSTLFCCILQGCVSVGAGPGLSILTSSPLPWPDFFSSGQSSGFCSLSTALFCSLLFYHFGEEILSISRIVQ